MDQPILLSIFKYVYNIDNVITIILLSYFIDKIREYVTIVDLNVLKF